MPLVRLAELAIDPADLEAYTAALRQEIEISVRDEPGVLAIYAVADKTDAAMLRLFEVYADEAAYTAHLASPHFRAYAEATKGMVRSKRLIGTTVVQLSAKDGC